MAGDAYTRAQVAAEALAARTGVRHDVAVVLGSGWTTAAETIGTTVDAFPATDLPGFPTPGVSGHSAELRSIDAGGRRILVSLGRVHAYEGHDLADVVHGIRTAVLAGCSTVVLTNAAGGMNPAYVVGQPVLIADQINLTGRSPLTGPNPDSFGPRFPDMTDLYAPSLRTRAQSLDATLVAGVYAGVPGPAFETPAEIRMMQTMGADLVGMSTVHESVAARHLGAQVLGMSLVTNMAAGMGPILAHEEVLAAAAEAAETMGSLLGRLVAEL